MGRRYQTRLDELLDDAEVRPGLPRGVLPRLGTSLEPFAQCYTIAEGEAAWVPETLCSAHPVGVWATGE